MNKIIGLICLLLLIFVMGCQSSKLLSRCEELKDVTIDNMNSIIELNTNFGYNMSYEKEIKNYNRLCEDVTETIYLPRTISVNLDIINDVKYEIRINCKWVKEHLNDTTVWFSNTTINICEDVFPELMGIKPKPPK